MDELDQRIVEMGEEIFRLYGLDNLSAKICSTLYFEPCELSMEEIAEHTGYSLSSISLKMGPLETIWGVKRKKISGSRKAYFYMEKDLVNMFIESFMKAQEVETRIIKKYLPPILNEYREVAKSEHQIKKLSILEDYCSQLTSFKRILEVLMEKIPEIRNEPGLKK